ncbi:tyrosine-type recombinase/integrase [Bacteroides eggerthii]|nr:tyrosine-type recombinase/integrase [Bacteroides eggerthii]
MRLFHRTRGKLFHMPSNAVCNRIIKRIYKKLFRGKKNISFHTGRHTAATLLLYHNTPLTTIKEILGHTNIRTTETYADINEATIYNSISKIRFRELEKAEKRIARTFSFRS